MCTIVAPVARQRNFTHAADRMQSVFHDRECRSGVSLSQKPPESIGRSRSGRQ